MLSLVPGEPESAKGPKPSKSVFGGARKLVQSLSGGGGNAPPGGGDVAKKQSGRSKKPATIEDIDRILEKDALDLTNMKREVVETQNAEIAKAQANLMTVQREYDSLRTANNSKERELNQILDTIRALENVGIARMETSDAAQAAKTALNDECDQTVENLEAEQRTLKMQTMMAQRLEREIVETKGECAAVSASHDALQHDLQQLEATLRLCRQELLESEKELESLLNTVKARKEERESKMGMMFDIVTESQSSVMRIKKELDHGDDKPHKQKGHHHHHHHRHVKQADDTAGGGGGGFGGPEDDNEGGEGGGRGLGGTGALGQLLQFRSPAQIADIIDRYNSRDSRLQRVMQQDGDMRESLVAQRRRREELSAQLAKTAAKHTMLASARQVYQEVDMKDAALASARKECNECRERESRLRQNIESISRAFPRFLTKITKIVHPIPTLDQLPDAVHKLEDEISKLIKTIDTAMLKEATTEDLATIGTGATGAPGGAGGGASGAPGGSSASEGVLSEMDRLQKLPGYDRLQRQLFYNLMTARPDVTDMNVRVHPVKRGKDLNTSPGKHGGAGGLNSRATAAYGVLFGSAGSAQHYGGPPTLDISNPVAEVTQLNEHRGHGELISDTQAIDRATIKSISRLVLEKDRAAASKGKQKTNTNNNGSNNNNQGNQKPSAPRTGGPKSGRNSLLNRLVSR